MFPKKLIVTFFIFALIVAAYHLSLLRPADRALRAIITPLQIKSIALAQTVNTEARFATTSKRALLLKVQELEGEVQRLTEELITLQQLKRENEDLRTLLAFQKETEYTLLTARVIHITNREGERVILLDKGSQDGVQKGDAVVVQKGTLIGKVIAVEQRAARVRLTIDPRSAVLATVGEGSAVIAGVARGNQATTILLELIPKTIPLKDGMRVYTNGLEEGIPRALSLGVIATLEESKHEIFNTASVIPPYTPENLTVAAVLIRQL